MPNQKASVNRKEKSSESLAILLLLILTTVALTSCGIAQYKNTTPTVIIQPTPLGGTTPITTSTYPPTQDWQLRWLKKIPCSAPCLEGIIPGKTTASEAIEILNHNSLVTNVKNNPKFDVAGKRGYVSWEWVNSQTSATASYSTDNSEIILDVMPDFGIYYSLRDVIQAYGEPTYVIAIAQLTVSERPKLCQEARFWYIPYGLVLRSDCHTKLDLDENLSFRLISFFAPGEAYIVIDSTGRQHPDWMIPWQGFKGFDFYCRDTQSGKLCRGETP